MDGRVTTMKDRALAMINEGHRILSELDNADKPKGWRADARRAANEHTGFVSNCKGVSWDSGNSKWRVYRKDLSIIGMFDNLEDAIAAKEADS
jgi:hypothetical protein